jgi:hypothetical protein
MSKISSGHRGRTVEAKAGGYAGEQTGGHESKQRIRRCKARKRRQERLPVAVRPDKQARTEVISAECRQASKKRRVVKIGRQSAAARRTDATKRREAKQADFQEATERKDLAGRKANTAGRSENRHASAFRCYKASQSGRQDT